MIVTILAGWFALSLTLGVTYAVAIHKGWRMR